MLSTLLSVLGSLGVLWGVFVFVYNRWEKAHLFVNRIRYWITNPTARWDVEIDCSGDFRIPGVAEAVNVLRLEFPDLRKRADNVLAVTAQAEGILIDVALDDERSALGEVRRFGHLVIRFSDVRAGYRESRQLVDRVASVVHRIVEAIPASRVKYSATVKFPGSNPYFGLYTRLIPASRVESFNCVLHPSANGTSGPDTGTVVINKGSVSLSAENPVHWQSLSRKYLAVR